MIGNKQIFANGWSYIMKKNEPMMSGHLVADFGIKWNSLFEIVAVLSIIAVFFEWIFGLDIFEKIGADVKEAELTTSEDLGIFSQSLSLRQSEEFVKEALNMRVNYGIEIIEPTILDSVARAGIPKKPILGTPWYSVLSNPIYAEDFCYVGAHVS
jgi:hypothetical protein